MAQTLYPRGTVKKIVKAHANRPVSKNVDILVCFPFPSFPEKYIYPTERVGGWWLERRQREREREN
jgi:hypothetical protein